MLTRTCIQCNKEFTMTESEIRFYKSKRLSLPKRCKDCRDMNKKGKEETGTTDDIATAQKENKSETGPNKQGKYSLLFTAIGAVIIIAVVVLVLVLM